MDRSTARLAIAIALTVFGGYRALFVPGLLGGSSPMLLTGFVLQAACGIAAGFGVWRAAAWAPLAIVLLGASVAATALVEGYVLEIVAALRALLEAVLAILACLALAVYVRRPGAARPLPDDGGWLRSVKLFTCSVCQQLLFFENSQCTQCGHRLAYVPEHSVLTALEPAPPGTEAGECFVALARAIEGERYRLCANASQSAACNWAVPASERAEFCRACRLNEVIPNLDDAEARAGWLTLESNKRRLLYTLIELRLPIESRAEQPKGLAFAFLKEDPAAGEQVFTGHDEGLITINLAEADAPFREKTRQALGESYRTLLGHFRHEVGHYYWDRLISDSSWLPGFRKLFGDESADYDEARQRHYENGPPGDWTARFLSSYASMHPWEDWAETWAHYLHMVDTLETARSFGLGLRPKPDGGTPPPTVATRRLDFDDFDELMLTWVPVTMAVNSLNRSMGLPDLYPFVVPAPAIEKLRFVHQVVQQTGANGSLSRGAGRAGVGGADVA